MKGFAKGNKLQREYWLGKKHSPETIEKMRVVKLGRKFTELQKQRMKASKSGERNPGWKGDNVGLGALHQWVRKIYPKPEFCQICNLKPPRDLSNINPTYNTETYNRDIKNWRWLCRRCHTISDGRVKNFTEFDSIPKAKIREKIIKLKQIKDKDLWYYGYSLLEWRIRIKTLEELLK